MRSEHMRPEHMHLGIRPYCASCHPNPTRNDFCKSDKEFGRHLTETETHPARMVRCQCRLLRKDHFLKSKHVNNCAQQHAQGGYVRCYCGKVQDIRSTACLKEIAKHVKTCKLGKKGRPKGSKNQKPSHGGATGCLL